MKICVKCPRCCHTLLLPSIAADRRLTCPKCFILFKVPALEELSDAVEALKSTRGNVFVDEKGNRFG